MRMGIDLGGTKTEIIGLDERRAKTDRNRMAPTRGDAPPNPRFNICPPERGISAGCAAAGNRLCRLQSAPSLSNGCAWTTACGQGGERDAGRTASLSDTCAPTGAAVQTFRTFVSAIPA